MGLEHRRAFFGPVERRSRMPEQVPPKLSQTTTITLRFVATRLILS